MTQSEQIEFSKRHAQDFRIDRTRITRIAFNAAFNLLMDIKAHEQGGTSAKREIEQFKRICKRFDVGNAIKHYPFE